MRVFAKHGFHKASIKQIAQEADIKSSALIYWYFKDKKELLVAVITELSPLKNLPAANPALRKSLMDAPPRQILTMMGRAFLSMLDDPDTASMMRLYISEAIRTQEVAEVISDFQREMLGFLLQFFQHHIEAGNLRPHDYQSTSRAFIGMWLSYLFATHVFIGVSEGLPPADEYVENVVDALLRGIENA